MSDAVDKFVERMKIVRDSTFRDAASLRAMVDAALNEYNANKDRRPHPAPVGVRVPDAANVAGPRTSYWDGYEDGYNSCREEVFRLNPQPGAEPLLSGDQAGVSNGCGVVGDVDKDALARKLYGKWTDNQDIHCNRFPSWNELHEGERVLWRRKVADSTLANPSKEPQK